MLIRKSLRSAKGLWGLYSGDSGSIVLTLNPCIARCTILLADLLLAAHFLTSSGVWTDWWRGGVLKHHLHIAMTPDDVSTKAHRAHHRMAKSILYHEMVTMLVAG